MDAHGIEPEEKTSASKQLQRADARAILEESTLVIVARGKRIERFETAGAIDDEVLDRFLGSTGNLRAPTVRTGRMTLVGFNEAAWSEVLLASSPKGGGGSRQAGGLSMNSAIARKRDRITASTGIRGRQIAQLLNTTPETVSRWRSGKVEPQSDRLEDLLILEWLIDELSELYSPQEARLWLYSPHGLLGGDRPVDQIQQGGLEKVRRIVMQLKDGAYV